MLAACSPALDVGSGAVIKCGDDSECPNGLTCSAGGRCLSAEAVNNAVSQPIFPEADAIVRAGTDVSFIWTPVNNAAFYTLYVFADGDPSRPAPGTPKIAAAPTETVQLPEGRYLWRAVPDIAASADAVALRGLASLGESVHVYCAADQDCAPGATETGLVSAPFRSIGRAVAVAARLGLHEVRVASRGGAGYRENIEIESGINLRGGYSPDFQSRGARTSVTGTDLVLRAVNLDEATRIEGFAFDRESGPSLLPLTQILNGGGALALDDCSFTAADKLVTLLAVEGAADATGARLSNCDFVATEGSASTVSRPAITLRNNGLLSFEASRFALTGNGSSRLEGAILVDSSSVTLNDVVLDISGCTNAVGIYAPLGDRVDVRGSTFDIQGTGEVYGFNVTVDALTLDRSTLTVAGGTEGSGVRLIGPPTATLLARNNAITVTGQRVAGFRFERVFAIVAGNSILMPSGAKRSGLVFGDASYSVIANNLISIDPNEGCEPGFDYERCYGMSNATELTVAAPYAVRNNAFVGFDNPPTTEPIAGGPSDVNGPYGFTLMGGNVSFADLVNAAPTALAGRGLDPTLDAPCRPTTGFARIELPNPACGGALDDVAGKVRPTFPAIGAREP